MTRKNAAIETDRGPTHDSNYKLLYSHTAMVSDLLQGFIPGAWIHELGLTTLEKCSDNYVSDDLRNRADDLIWRVRWGRDWLYVYLLLEFQSTIDREYPVSPYFAFSEPLQTRQGKAQHAGNRTSIAKRCNTALARLGGSLRARREAAICVVARA